MAPSTTKKSTKVSPSKPPTKTELVSQLSAKSTLSKSQVRDVLGALDEVIAESLARYRSFTLPGLAKIKVSDKAATKSRPGRNPFTGEEITIKAKPARKTVRLSALKPLKDSVA
jgi:nucleoid DNA-binding protein